jgi:hypothetical protein
MAGNAHHDFYRRLMEATASEVDPRKVDANRRALMALIAEIFGLGRCAVLLWLVDSGGCPEVPELRLAYVWFGNEPRCERPVELRNRILSEKQNPATTPLDWLSTWYRSTFPGGGHPASWSYPLRDKGSLIGHVHVLSHAPQAEREAAKGDPRLTTALAALTTKIVVGREVRESGAMQRLQEALGKIRSDEKVWQAIADIAREFTAAKLALVYRPFGVAEGRRLAAYAGALKGPVGPQNLTESELGGLASAADTVTWAAFGQPEVIRLRDIHDEDEVYSHFQMRPPPIC